MERQREHRKLETAVCAWRGHETPAATTADVEVRDLVLGVDVDGPPGRSWRLARCLRCDAWLPVSRPEAGHAGALPAPEELHLPRRGKELRSAVVMRLIAIERGVHSVFFLVVAVLAILLRSELAGVKSWVRHVLAQLTANTNGTNALGGSYVIKEGNRLLALRSSTLTVVIIAAVAYFVVEGVEAVGLWRERRWAEYLTVVATVGFIPYEVIELLKGISAIKVVALILNVAVLVYLVWAKRLFGLDRVRRGREPAPPTPADLYGYPVATAANH
ncbi:DUF2127 domain-containing protein [Acidiferrimicrobium sp. IK]|uniref:DUF2127 domain-containing protein n=1 Tax=Acidiferrimicrobium sp. IK TaxID=2871700 RepID=UPI0021CAFD5A|nr:DUF2127 domain-containing protein [Acidiferrimicrobium sp. IK]MCU4184380.1 DUF2127 domain-containing protein [Acidiferrimicrobium sp. IK]